MRRALAFPHLKRTRPPRGPSLDSQFDRLKPQPVAPAVADRVPVQAEGSLEAAGVFVGRDGAFYVLERAARLQRVVVVHGPGGAGKTELAKAFARWWRDSGGLDHKDWVFFHSFEPGLPSFGLDGVVNALGLDLFGPDFIGRTENAAHRRKVILDALREHRMLLIWDNFESVRSMPDLTGATPPLDAAGCEEMRAFLAALAAPGGRSALIVTSRTTEDWLGDVRRVELGGLRPQEAAEYADILLAPYPAAQQRRKLPAFAELLDALEGHPLSLRLMLPQLDTADPGTLLAALRGDAPLPAGFDDSEHRTRSLAASVKYSLDQMAAPIRGVLPALSLFEGVADADVLGNFSEQDGVPARFAGRSAAAWNDALDAAARVGLLTALGGGMYRLHPALPAYFNAQWRADAGAAFAGERGAADEALLRAHADFGDWLLQQIMSGSAETALAVIDLQRRTMGRLIALGLAKARYGPIQKILQPLNEYWTARGLRQEAQGWTDRIRAALESGGGTALAFDTEAGALWLFVAGSEANRAQMAGDLDGAERVWDELRRTLESAPKSDQRDRRLAVACHNLGRVAEDRGDIAAAEGWSLKSLEIKEALGDRPGMAASYHQFGSVAYLHGDLGAAECWTRKALEVKKALGNRPGMASSYHQLGMIAQRRGDLGAAEGWCRKSLDIKKALGDRPGMALSYGQLGLLAEARDDMAAALDWSVRCVFILTELSHPLIETGIRQMAPFVAQLGMSSLEGRWQRCTGQPLPDAVRAAVAHMIDEMGRAD